MQDVYDVCGKGELDDDGGFLLTTRGRQSISRPLVY